MKLKTLFLLAALTTTIVLVAALQVVSSHPQAGNHETVTVTVTRTFPNGSTSTTTYLQTAIVCSSDCEPRRTFPQWSIAIDEVHFDTGTETANMVLRNVGAVSVTLDKAIISGYQTNTGFQGEITVDLQSVPLEKNQITTIKSPRLPNLVAGDSISIKVTTKEGSFAILSEIVN